MDKVIGLGNALVDILATLENDVLLQKLNLPKGSMQLVDKETSAKIFDQIRHKNISQISGGSASNTIHGLAQLGVSTAFIGKVGTDHFGTFFKEDMVKSGIKPLLLESKTESGTAIALISPDSERTFATFLGAAVELTPNDLTKEIFEGYKYLHIEGYLVQNHELIRKAIETAKELGMIISLDLASYNVVDANREFLIDIVTNYVDILFANEEEGKSFTGLEGDDALNKMAELADIAIYKQGKSGSLIKHNNNVFRVDPIAANCIDTTGAGDLYAAGFLFGLINDFPLDKCGKIGSITSGNVVQIIGPKIKDEQWISIKNEIAAL